MSNYHMTVQFKLKTTTFQFKKDHLL